MQLTRRNCPLLNCESVLWGIEADGRRPRSSRAPQRSETKISSTRLSSMTRNGLIATCFVCLLIAGNWPRSWPRPEETPDAIPPQCVASSRRLLYRRSIFGLTNRRRLSVGGHLDSFPAGNGESIESSGKNASVGPRRRCMSRMRSRALASVRS